MNVMITKSPSEFHRVFLFSTFSVPLKTPTTLSQNEGVLSFTSNHLKVEFSSRNSDKMCYVGHWKKKIMLCVRFGLKVRLYNNL